MSLNLYYGKPAAPSAIRRAPVRHYSEWNRKIYNMNNVGF